MPYSPKVKNKSGEIYAEGIANAADFESRGIKGSAAYQAEGIERRAAGFASGIETAGVKIAGGIRDAGEIFEQRRLEKAAEGQVEYLAGQNRRAARTRLYIGS
jgi:hypothetical protein